MKFGDPKPPRQRLRPRDRRAHSVVARKQLVESGDRPPVSTEPRVDIRANAGPDVAIDKLGLGSVFFFWATTISVPQDWVESVTALKFPESTDRRLQELMDLNNEGRLNPTEQFELEALVEMSEELSLVRAQALRLLERDPA